MNYKEYKTEEHLGWSLKYLLHREPLARRYMRFLRKAQTAKNPILRWYWDKKRAILGERHNIEIFKECSIGKGLYIGHVGGGVTINPRAVLGEHVCIHKGVTIGVENRGRRKGYPVIGNCVWIGINAIVYGNVRIGDDVLISPNSVVNIDVPSHCIVYGNPCVIKHRDHATEGYISDITYLKYFQNEKNINNKL